MIDLYRFGQFVLDRRRRTLSRADSPVLLTPKAFDVLLFLVQNPNRLVTKEELLQAVWGDTFVEEGNLTQYISHLRKALGNNPEDTRLIVTIARKGYQFTAPVIAGSANDPPSQTSEQVPEQANGLVANAESGSGPAALVSRARSNRRLTSVVLAATVVLAVGGYVAWDRLRAASANSTRVMLAVLPFQNLTGDPNTEYLADGLTEEMISQLGRIDQERLGVIARTSVMGYKQKSERLEQIGRDLSVQYVLENSLRKSGDQIRITSQLLRVKDQSRLWSHDFDYRAQDVLVVQERTARAVAREIQVRLTARQEAALARSRSVNPEAFDAYLRGYYFFERNTDSDTDMAATYYERATQLDPSYALAWVGLSRVRRVQAFRHRIPTEEGQRVAREAIERALSLDPNLAVAYVELARRKLFVDFDLAGADAAAKRAMALEPGVPENVRIAAGAAKFMDRLDEALDLSRRAIGLDPLNAGSWVGLAETEFFIGRLEEAAADDKKAVELNPNVWIGHFLLGKIYLMLGRPADALREVELIQYDSQRTFLSAMAYYAIGRRQESDAALNELIANQQALAPYSIATVYAFRNSADRAFEWLDRALARREGDVIGTRIDPLLRTLHDDPRFAAFLKKIPLQN